jgi:hypothetical protein
MNRSSYLLIADDTIDLSLNKQKKSSLKAHFKHALLFEETIVLSDSQVIGNKNFRTLIEEDSEFAELFNKNNFSIAMRDCMDFCPYIKNEPLKVIYDPTLAEILEGFVSWNKNNWGNNKKTKLRYAADHDINIISQKATIGRYDLKEINKVYSNEAIDIFTADNVQAILGNKISTKVYELSKAKRDYYVSNFSPQGGFGIIYFKQQLKDEFIKAGLQKEWRAYGNKIIEIAQAPYLTALPKVFNANPVYGAMHKRSIELLKGTLPKSRIIGNVRHYESRLLRFEEGINRLSTASIYKLRESSEYKEFRKAIFHYNGSESTFQNVLFTLEEYKNRVDDEILLSFPELREPGKIKREKIETLELTYNTSTYGGLLLGAMAIATLGFPGLDELGLGLGLLSLFIDKKLPKIKKKENFATEIEKNALNDMLNKDGQGSTINSELLLNNYDPFFKKEVFYSSVEK